MTAVSIYTEAALFSKIPVSALHISALDCLVPQRGNFSGSLEQDFCIDQRPFLSLCV